MCCVGFVRALCALPRDRERGRGGKARRGAFVAEKRVRARSIRCSLACALPVGEGKAPGVRPGVGCLGQPQSKQAQPMVDASDAVGLQEEAGWSSWIQSTQPPPSIVRRLTPQPPSLRRTQASNPTPQQCACHAAGSSVDDDGRTGQGTEAARAAGGGGQRGGHDGGGPDDDDGLLRLVRLG